jgi:hypothetical protein
MWHFAIISQVISCQGSSLELFKQLDHADAHGKEHDHGA